MANLRKREKMFRLYDKDKETIIAEATEKDARISLTAITDHKCMENFIRSYFIDDKKGLCIEVKRIIGRYYWTDRYDFTQFEDNKYYLTNYVDDIYRS